MIDAAELVQFPAIHVDAAFAHARTCATCGPASDAAARIPRAFQTLEFRATPDLTRRVMDRIAAVPAAAAQADEHAALESPVNWAPGVNAVGLAATGLAVAWPIVSGVTGSTLSLGDGVQLPTPSATATLVTVLSLTVYVLTLFAASATANRLPEE